jgi:hypothetical protein
MAYFIFKKDGREDDELMKTILALNGVGGNPMEARGVISMELTVTIVLFLAAIGFTPITAFLLLCINS